MNEVRGRLRLVAALLVAGLCFSGYLSAVKFFTSTCALSEQCPYFLGYPACYYGFAMYLIMSIFFIQYSFGWVTRRAFLTAAQIISGVGILFAGYYTIGEMPKILSEGITAYVLGLPSCAYGLLVYTAIFVITYRIPRE